jgi:hypothetical protein
VFIPNGETREECSLTDIFLRASQRKLIILEITTPSSRSAKEPHPQSRVLFRVLLVPLKSPAERVLFDNYN